MSSTNLTQYIYAYCHGLLSNQFSTKGTYFATIFSNRFSLQLHLLNLNGGEDMSKITFKTAFQAIDELWNSENKNDWLNPKKLRLIGSSFGGQTAASYAARYPERVDRLILLCPAVNMQQTLEQLVSKMDSNAMNLWKSTGYLPFPKPYTGEPINIPYSFLSACQEVPPYPEYNCDTSLIQGKYDDIVKLGDIKEFLEKCPHQAKLTKLVVVDDDHNLLKKETLDTIEVSIEESFDFRRVQK